MCHSLEHIGLNLIPDFLIYLRRLLKEQGQIYISVPDFEILSSIYLSRKVSLSQIVRAIHGGQEYEGNTHYISFDIEFLSRLLQLVFKRKRYEPSVFLPSGVEILLPMINGYPISLNLMAYCKPN